MPPKKTKKAKPKRAKGKNKTKMSQVKTFSRHCAGRRRAHRTRRWRGSGRRGREGAFLNMPMGSGTTHAPPPTGYGPPMGYGPQSLPPPLGPPRPPPVVKSEVPLKVPKPEPRR